MTIVKSLDLHQNPENKEEWAVSFIYDDQGPLSDDGDIIRTGTYAEMKEIYDNWTKLGLVGTEYGQAIKLI